MLRGVNQETTIDFLQLHKDVVLNQIMDSKLTLDPSLH